MDAFDEVDVVHHRKNGENGPNLSVKMDYFRTSV